MRRVYNDNNRAAWVARGYPRDMASAAVSEPPPLGYRRVYHFTPATHAISDIVFRRMKVARFSEMNDPIELLAFMPGPAGQKAFRQYREEANKANGVLCWSADWREPVLWSHYADRHRGICLGFDLKE